MENTILELPQKELFKGIRARFFHTQHNTIGYVELDEGAILPEHSHINEQTTEVIKGFLELTVNGITHPLKAGSIIHIPSNVSHSAVAKKSCYVRDIFYPAREDYK